MAMECPYLPGYCPLHNDLSLGSVFAGNDVGNASHRAGAGQMVLNVDI